MEELGRGEDKAIIWEGRGNVGLWEGGRRELIKNKGTFASCLFPPSGVCKLFFLYECVCACARGASACVYGRVYVVRMCVCKHVFWGGEGSWGGGFCNVFCRKRTQMTFNRQCFGGNSRVLFARCNFARLEIGVPACIRETELGS